MEESESDIDSENNYDDFHDDKMTPDTARKEDKDEKEDSKPTAQERRLGIDINMNGT